MTSATWYCSSQAASTRTTYLYVPLRFDLGLSFPLRSASVDPARGELSVRRVSLFVDSDRKKQIDLEFELTTKQAFKFNSVWSSIHHMHSAGKVVVAPPGQPPIRVVQGSLSFSIAELGITVELPAPAPFKFCPPSPTSSQLAPPPLTKTVAPADITSSIQAAPRTMEAKPAVSPARPTPALPRGLCEDFGVIFKSGPDELVANPPGIELLVDDAQCAWLHFRTHCGEQSHSVDQPAVILRCLLTHSSHS